MRPMHGDDLDDDLWWQSPQDEAFRELLREGAEAEREKWRQIYAEGDQAQADLLAALGEDAPADLPPVIKPGWLS